MPDINNPTVNNPTDNPTALISHNQPMVNRLTNQCRVISPTITARNWQSQGYELSGRVSQLYVLTGDTRLSKYMSGSGT